MTATFPSISDPNWSKMFKTPLSVGYTKAHFDATKVSSNGKGQIVGSLIDHLKTPTAYEEGFDFKAEGFWQHFAMITWLETSALYWLDSVEKQFFETRDKKSFFALIINSDLIAHLEGEQTLMKYLVVVDKRLQKIRARYRNDFGSDLEIVLVSDHGNAFLDPKMIDFEKPLSAKGWKFKETLKDPRDVVFVAPEILSFGAFYLDEQNKFDFGKDMAQVKGVDMSMASQSDQEILVWAHSGETLIRVIADPKNEMVDMKVEKGKDPFGQADLFKNGPISWKKYFNQTLSGPYPNALVRIWEGFHKNSLQPAQVLVSSARPYAFSNFTLELITTLKSLRSLHGSLRKEESQGIFASTSEAASIPITPQEFSEYVDISEFGRKSLKN